MVVYANIFNISNFAIVDIEAELAVSVIFGIHRGDHFVGIQTSVVRENSGNDFKGIGKFDIGVPVQSFDMVSFGFKGTGQSDFGASSTWAESTVLGHAFVHIHRVIDSPLDIIKRVLGVTAQHDRRVPSII